MQTATEDGQSYRRTNTAINPPTGLNIQSKLHHDDSKFHNKSNASYTHRFHTARIQTFSGNSNNNPTAPVCKVTYISQDYTILLPSGYFLRDYGLILMQ